MIEISYVKVHGIDAAIRGMRNPLNSWDKSDSGYGYDSEEDDIVYRVGEADLELARKLAKGGAVHAKYRRMIVVYADITAPLYIFKQLDTYKIGTVANSCSTMHTIHKKEFTLDDFSHEHLKDYGGFQNTALFESGLKNTIELLNVARKLFLQTGDKQYWWQIIQLLPSSYNQKRTMMFNYEVLCNIYHSRKDHKLDEWHTFCDWIETLPYSELITLKEG